VASTSSGGIASSCSDASNAAVLKLLAFVQSFSLNQDSTITMAVERQCTLNLAAHDLLYVFSWLGSLTLSHCSSYALYYTVYRCEF
jgi:hypothetical protein